MRGRRPEPAQSNVLKGNFRADRHSHGPTVEMGLPDCPRWLPKAAKKVWKEIGPQLARDGLIAKIDQLEFATLCDCEALYKETVERIQSLDDLYEKTPNGFQVVSALFVIRNKLIDQLDKQRAKFGMNNIARRQIGNAQQQGQLPLNGFEGV